MKIITDTLHVPSFPSLVATIGCFDGMHRGHNYLINQVCSEAEQKGMKSALITFPIHPRQVIQTEYCPELLTCLPQKMEQMRQQRADYCILLSFTHELSLLSAREFMQLLRDKFHVQALLIGYDHRFGHNRSECFEDYVRYGAELGMEVIQAKALMEDGVSISSSIIRDLLKKGEVAKANHYLGYRYYLDGIVVDGYKVGRKLGFPTANLQPSCSEKLLPAHGVYAVHVYIDNRCYAGMLNIGHRPTLNNGDNVSIEVNILHFSDNIYQRQLKVEFVQYIRPERKFDSTEALVQQIETDREQVERLLK